MKRFASHRLYIPHLDLLLKNQVVEIDVPGGEVSNYYPFIGEIPYTEWLNGLIVLSYHKPCISENPVSFAPNDAVVLYVDENKEIRNVLPSDDDTSLLTLKAYYVTMFNVSEMSFSQNSRVIQLF